MSAAYFVTGTDTEVGKTLSACALIHALRARGHVTLGMKPVAAGCDAQGENADVRQLIAASSQQAALDDVSPYRFQAAMAPHLAARQESIDIEPGRILNAFRRLTDQADRVVVEGAGGFRIPLAHVEGKPWDSADLATDLGCPVILVVGLRLGCINHALLTAEAIEQRGLVLAGWIGNLMDPAMLGIEENINTLRTLLAAPMLGIIPHLSQPEDAVQASQWLNLDELE